MKTLYYILLLWVANTYAIRGAETNELKWGPMVGNVQMSIHLKDGGNEIKTNQPIDLVVRIRNLSTNETLNFSMWTGAEVSPPESTLTVLSPSGKDIYVPHSVELKDGSIRGSFKHVSVPPQSASEYGFYLGRISDYDTNGIYKIVATRKTLRGLTVTSNPLYLKVVPGEWKDPIVRFP